MSNAGADAVFGHSQSPVLHEFGGSIALETLEVPSPEAGAIVVRMLTATVCGSDVHLWRGDTKDALPTRLPLVLGHEVVGEIVALGEGSHIDSIGQGLSIGDRIIWAPVPCGHCHTCTIVGLPNLCPDLGVGMHRSVEEFPYAHGGFNEFVYIPAGSRRVRVPDSVQNTWAASASCAGRSAAAVVRRAGRIESIDTVLVQGAGPLGLFVVAMASISSPRELIVIDSDLNRLKLAKAWGATHTVELDFTGTRHLDEVLRLTDGRGPDVGFECSGGPGAFAQGVDMMARGGRYLVSGTVGGARQNVDVAKICLSGLLVQGVFSAGIDDYSRALEFMGRHADRFDWNAMFGDTTFGLDEIESALVAMRDRVFIKPVVVPRTGRPS